MERECFDVIPLLPAHSLLVDRTSSDDRLMQLLHLVAGAGQSCDRLRRRSLECGTRCYRSATRVRYELDRDAFRELRRVCNTGLERCDVICGACSATSHLPWRGHHVTRTHLTSCNQIVGDIKQTNRKSGMESAQELCCDTTNSFSGVTQQRHCATILVNLDSLPFTRSQVCCLSQSGDAVQKYGHIKL